MKKIFKVILAVLIFLATVALSVYYISVNEIAVLEPKGMIGEKESELIITASLLMLIVVIPVFILTWVFAWRYREGNEKARHAPDWEHNYIAEYCWWGVPVVIIIILAVITWKSSHDLNPFKPIDIGQAGDSDPGRRAQWKWLFIYPDYGIATVNPSSSPKRLPRAFDHLRCADELVLDPPARWTDLRDAWHGLQTPPDRQGDGNFQRRLRQLKRQRICGDDFQGHLLHR